MNVAKPWTYPFDPPATVPTVGTGDEGQALHAAESRAVEAVKRVATEIAKLAAAAGWKGWGVQEGKPGFHTKSVPEALAAVLNCFDPTHAIAGAAGYLQHLGFTVIAPDEWSRRKENAP